MLRLIALALGLVCGITAALAADMPIKAPPKFSNPFINYAGSGIYWFGGVFGGSTNVATETGHLASSGGGGSAGAGWMWGRTTTWTAVDVRGNYSTASATGICALGTVCSLRQNVSIEARVKYGSDSTALAAWLPNLGLSSLFDVLPVLPGGTQTPSHPYVFGYGEAARNKTDIGIVDIQKWRTEVGLGVGMVHQLGASKAIDTWAKCGVDTGSRVVAGTSSIRLGTTCKGGVDLIF